MPSLYLDELQLQEWRVVNGNYTHNLDYPLNEDSIIMDLGGYTGMWVGQMIEKYNCSVYVAEPLKEFYDTMVSKFESNLKVNLLNVGVATEDREGVIYLGDDSSSSNIETETIRKVEFRTINSILKEWDLKEVDLLQVNIEGDEYPVVAHMIETGDIDRFKNIQIQFHLGIEDATSKREKICKDLETRGFKVKYSYPFVWEGWTRI